MKAIIEKLQRIASLDKDKIVEDILENPGVQQQMIDWNQHQLYELGVDAEGEPTGDYSNYTKQIKIQNGQRIDHITLKDTGDFYDSMEVKVTGDSAVITGDMQKEGTDLEKQWPDALGLTDESKSEIISIFKELFIEAVREEIEG